MTNRVQQSGSNYGGYNAEGGAFDFTYDEEFALRWGAKANGTGKPRVIKAYVKAEKTFYSYNGKFRSDLESVIPKQTTAKEKRICDVTWNCFQRDSY